MRLKSLTLENIRTYSSAKIDFPEGAVLLAGDIGSGKSSILLAIEFALFGLKQGELSGNLLLSHGAREGSVALELEIDSKKISIYRSLKRVKDKIGQGSGYLLINNEKTELMPKELRAKIFELLCYPESLLSKNQDLIYRFTVYTPQEEMKKILYEDKDVRLDTLRKVFNIDKYKRIRENSFIFLRSLKERRSYQQGMIENLDEKKKQKADLQLQADVFKEKLMLTRKKVEESKAAVQQKKQHIKELEETINLLKERKKELSLLDLELKSTVEKRERDKKEIDLLVNAVALLREEVKEFLDPSFLRKELSQKELTRMQLEKEMMQIKTKQSEIQGKSNHIRQESEKVTKLQDCPLCLQQVANQHKESIIKRTTESLAQLKDEFDGLERKEKEISHFLENAIKELRQFQEKISKNTALQVKKELLEEKQKRLHELTSFFDESKKKIAQVNTKKLEISAQIEKQKDSEQIYEGERKSFEMLLLEEKKSEIVYAQNAKEKEGIERQVNVLIEEINQKELTKKELAKTVSLQEFVEKKFISLVGNMEKHVFMTVYHEFNSFFQNWLSMLLEDTAISARLDDTFSVIIEQNGYETTIDNLSGGEKTSVALAYRLALNRVINDVMSHINTKDLLILDEPTEGFSNDQLDRVRDVLEQLKMKQTIIVSHENKIESFVDHVIRVHKQNGESKIFA